MTAVYETLLAIKGSYMSWIPLKITDISKTLCRSLLTTEQTVSQNTLFCDDLFEETCDSVWGRNEAMVLRHISFLICLSILVSQIYDVKDLNCLIKSVNKGWNSAIAVVYSHSQPNYSVGFARSTFTDKQLEKLKPLVDEIKDLYTFYFMSTWQMYFLFLTCEVKCSITALDVVNWQNTHSMIIAVRAVIKLFRYVKHKQELHQKILTFLILYDHRLMRIYDHYVIIDDDKTTFYHHLIHTFDFTALNGKEK